MEDVMKPRRVHSTTGSKHLILMNNNSYFLFLTIVLFSLQCHLWNPPAFSTSHYYDLPPTKLASLKINSSDDMEEMLGWYVLVILQSGTIQVFNFKNRKITIILRGTILAIMFAFFIFPWLINLLDLYPICIINRIFEKNYLLL